LIPAIAQDVETGDVLMLAYMNQQSYDETLKTGQVCYYSRSRQKLWRKGEESGNVQKLHEIYYDCDADTLLVKVTQVGGAACHEGYKSCFFRKVDPATGEIEVVGERVFDPAVVYKKS
jgi:phosphoribosyl-AMP cyclohydrolase